MKRKVQLKPSLYAIFGMRTRSYDRFLESALCCWQQSADQFAGYGYRPNFCSLLSSLTISIPELYSPSVADDCPDMIAAWVILFDIILKAVPDISRALGPYVGLIITNCIIMGRAEAFAQMNPPLESLLDGVFAGLGYTIVLVIIAFVRELLGFGTILGVDVNFIGFETWTIMVMPPAAFFLVGVMFGSLTTLSHASRLEVESVGSAPAISPFVIFLASIFTSNMVLSNFLGMCSFISVSSEYKTATGLGKAVLLVMVFTTVINWLLYHYVMVPLGLDYLRYLLFIIVIAATVQIIEMFMDRYLTDLHMKLGIFLPLITVNCAILGINLLPIIRSYSFLQTAIRHRQRTRLVATIAALAAIRGKLPAMNCLQAEDRPSPS